MSADTYIYIHAHIFESLFWLCDNVFLFEKLRQVPHADLIASIAVEIWALDTLCRPIHTHNHTHDICVLDIYSYYIYSILYLYILCISIGFPSPSLCFHVPLPGP